jgi:hypothetical protein
VATKGKGKAHQWILSHVDYPHDDHCLTWPFSTIRGYGHFGHLGETFYAHSFMCELVHGKRPSPQHQAAHSCGMGKNGCTNPRHISWKTQSENELDKFTHGTAHQLPGRIRTKLTHDDVAQIRRLAPTTTHEDLAIQFGVGRSTIGAILTGRSWNIDRNKHQLFMPSDDAKIRDLFQEGHTGSQISRIIGRHVASVARRLKMMGLATSAERE